MNAKVQASVVMVHIFRYTAKFSHSTLEHPLKWSVENIHKVLLALFQYD